MLFNSLDFLLFFVVVLCAYQLLVGSWGARKWLLLLSSWGFYMCWEPAFVLLLIGSTVLDFVAGRQIATREDATTRKAWLAASCVGNLGVLAIFKYGDFALTNL